MTRKKVPALLASGVLALTLTACGDAADTTAQSAPPPPPTTSEAASGVQELILGETMNITRCGGDAPCNVQVTLTDVTLTETCPLGVSYPDMGSTDPEGSLYLTFDGEFHVIDSPTNFALGVNDFTAVNSDGYATTDLTAWDCESLDVNQHLDNPVDPGLKRAGHITLAIPDDTETVRFTQFWEPVIWELDITGLEVETGAGERPSPAAQTNDSAPAPASDAPSPTPRVIEQSPAPVPPAADPVVGFTGAPGVEAPRVLDKTIASCGEPMLHQTGTTFFTDGTSGWTQQCADQMGY